MTLKQKISWIKIMIEDYTDNLKTLDRNECDRILDMRGLETLTTALTLMELAFNGRT